MVPKVKVGIIGCGNVSAQYIQNMQTYDILEVKSVADIDCEKASAAAAAHHLQAVDVDELLSDPEIQIAVNLTIPSTHTEVSLRCIAAGKSLYNEKPLAITPADARMILDAARKKGVLVGCAPDTFLGGGLQTCRNLIDSGWIGQPVAASAFFTTHGPEGWHPNPEFYYKPGAGPIFDLGPYLLTALVSLLGPIRRVAAMARISFPERVILSQPLHGARIQVEVPTYAAGAIEFASGPAASFTTSFDIWDTTQPRIEIYGSDGTLSLPGPNKFAGPVLMRRAGAAQWSEMPLSHHADVGRGIGVADLAYALTSGRKPRASGELAYHILDATHAVLEASERGQHVAVESTCDRPAPLPPGLRRSELDL